MTILVEFCGADEGFSDFFLGTLAVSHRSGLPGMLSESELPSLLSLSLESIVLSPSLPLLLEQSVASFG